MTALASSGRAAADLCNTGKGAASQEPRCLRACQRTHANARAGLRAIPPVVAGILLSACAAAAGVTQIARTTYSVEKLGHGTDSVLTHSYVGVSGLEDAKADNARAASKYCAKKGLPATVVISDIGYGGVSPDDTLTFRCDAQATVQLPSE